MNNQRKEKCYDCGYYGFMNDRWCPDCGGIKGSKRQALTSGKSMNIGHMKCDPFADAMDMIGQADDSIYNE